MEYKLHTILSLTVASHYSSRKLILVSYCGKAYYQSVMFPLNYATKVSWTNHVFMGLGSTAVFSHSMKGIAVLLPL